jgi:G3E family GTPase
LQETVARFAPDRVLIEPSGVADIASLIGVMNRPALAPFVGAQTITTIIDAAAFLADYAKLPAHFAAQATLANTVVINKSDLVSPAEKSAVAETLRRLNPAVAILTARYGHIDPAPRIALVHDIAAQAHHEAHAPARAHDHKNHDHAHEAHDHDHDHHAAHAHNDAGLGYTSWHTDLPAPVDADALSALLDAIVTGTYGDIKRVKGLVKSGAGWLHFDVAGNRPSLTAFAATATETPRVVAIGPSIDAPALAAAFTACTIKKAA